MKKTNAFLLTVLLAAGLTACGGTVLPGVTAAVSVKVPRSMEVFQTEEEKEAVPAGTDQPEQPGEGLVKKLLAEMVDMPEILLLQESGVEIYVNGYIPEHKVTPNYGGGPAFRLRCVNHTNRPLLITAAYASVNNVEMDNVCAFTVESQSEAENVLYTYTRDYTFLDIDVPKKLEAWFVIFDGVNTNDRYLLADPVTADLPLGGESWSMDKTGGQVIYEKDGVRVELFSELRELRSAYGVYYSVDGLVTNNSDVSIVAGSRDFAVNDAITAPMAVTVRPGKQGLMSAMVSQGQLEEAGSDTVKTASGSFLIRKIQDITAREWDVTEIEIPDPVTLTLQQEESLGYVMMDQDGMKVTLDRIYEDAMFDFYDVLLTMENHSDKNETVSMVDLFINGISFGNQNMVFISAEPGEVTRNDKILVSKTELEKYGIEKIKTISVRLRYDKGDTSYTGDYYTYTPFVNITLDEDSESDFQKPEALFLMETQGIRLSLVSFGEEGHEALDGSWLKESNIYLMAENQSDKDIKLTNAEDKTRVDGKRAGGDFAAVIPAGACAIEPFEVGLRDNKQFSDIDSVRFTLNYTDLSNNTPGIPMTLILDFE